MKEWVYMVLFKFHFHHITLLNESSRHLDELKERIYHKCEILMKEENGFHSTWGLEIKHVKINTNILQQWNLMWNPACRFPVTGLKPLLPVPRSCPDNGFVAMEASSILLTLGSPKNGFTWFFSLNLGEKITTNKWKHINNEVIWSLQVRKTSFHMIQSCRGNRMS